MTENTVPETTTNPKAALLRKGLILLGTAAGIALATGVTLPKKNKTTSVDWDAINEEFNSRDVNPDA